MPFIRPKKEPGKENNAAVRVVNHQCERKNPETKNPLDPDGTGAGLSRHCSAIVFSSQTIDLQVVGELGPCQQTQSGPVAIKGPQILRRSSSS